MKTTDYARWKSVLLIVALLMLLIEIPGARRTYNIPYSGYWTDGQSTVIKVLPDSPAERAGLLKGDIILKADGIEMKDLKALARRPILKIGDQRTYTVQRAGDTLDIPIIYGRNSMKNQILNFSSTLIGLCIIFFGLYPYIKVQTKNTFLFAVGSLGLGFSFLDMPTFDALALRILVSTIWQIIVLWGFASLLHFMLSFPKPKTLLSKKYILCFLYGIPIFVILFYLASNIILPDATPTMRTLWRVVYMGVTSIYLILALSAFVHSYIVSSLAEKKEHKLNVAFWGFVIGLVPILISTIIYIIFPKVILPGGEFYFYLLVIIPISLAVSVLKTERAG